jgi:hypothetical protein
MDGDDAHTTFTDNAVGTTGETVTANGTAQGDTAQYKFGTASLLLDGDSDYLSITDDDGVSDHWNVGSSALTIDFWVRYNALPTDPDNRGMGFVQQYDTLSTHFQFFVWFTGSTWRLAVGRVGRIYSYRTLDTAPVVDTWYHYALTRGADTVARIYVNGIQQGATFNLSGTYWDDYAADLMIGYVSYEGTDCYFNGWIDEFRITKAEKWTTNFAVPSRAYPNSATWAGSVNGADHPTKVATIAGTSILSVNGVGSMGGG